MNTSKKKKEILKSDQTQEAAPVNGAASTHLKKPNVFHYHDYVQFLNDWILYHKKNQKGFSLRKLSAASEISIGYLPMVLSGQRPLSIESFNKLAPELKLGKSELQFFSCIHSLGTSHSQGERLECLNQMRRYSEYRNHYPNESEVYRYLTKWYYFTIREMAADPDFKLEAEWVQGRLREHVSLAEINEALSFLTENKYILISDQGAIIPPAKHLKCEGGIYKVALTEYHRQLLQLSEKSIENANSNERYLIGHTFAISETQFGQIQELIKDVVTKIQIITNASDAGSKDSVYHVEMALFPLTLSKEKK